MHTTCNECGQTKPDKPTRIAIIVTGDIDATTEHDHTVLAHQFNKLAREAGLGDRAITTNYR